METPEKETLVFNDHLKIRKGEFIDEQGKTYSRLRGERPDAAVVLLFNSDTGCYVLTRQSRYAIAEKSEEDILEAIAGKADPGESPEAAAVRETMEETGYAIREQDLEFLGAYVASPGYSSERFFIYSATVRNSHKTGKGGGEASEHESIRIVEVPRENFNKMLKNKELKDSKTMLAGLLIALE